MELDLRLDSGNFQGSQIESWVEFCILWVTVNLPLTGTFCLDLSHSRWMNCFVWWVLGLVCKVLRRTVPYKWLGLRVSIALVCFFRVHLLKHRNFVWIMLDPIWDKDDSVEFDAVFLNKAFVRIKLYPSLFTWLHHGMQVCISLIHSDQKWWWCCWLCLLHSCII